MNNYKIIFFLKLALYGKMVFISRVTQLQRQMILRNFFISIKVELKMILIAYASWSKMNLLRYLSRDS